MMKLTKILAVRKIWTRLIIASVGSAVIVFLACLLGLRSMASIQQANAAVAALEAVRSRLVQGELDHYRWAQKAGAFQGDEKVTKIDVVKDPRQSDFGQWYYGEGRRALEAMLPEVSPQLSRLEEPHHHLFASVAAIEKLLGQGPEHRQSAIAMFNNQSVSHLNQVQGLLAAVEQQLDQRIKEIERQSAAQVTSTRGRMLGGTIFFLGLMLLAGRFFAQMITRPIHEVIRVTRELASGEADLTRRLPMPRVNCSFAKNCGHNSCPEFGKETNCWNTVGSNAPGEIRCPAVLSGKIRSCHECSVLQASVTAEFDELALWLNTFIGAISHIVKEVKNNTATLTQASGELSMVSSELLQNFNAMTSQAGSVTRTTEQMSLNIDAMASASRQMSADTGRVASAAEQMSRKTSLVSGAVVEMTASINKIDENARAADDVAKDADTMAGEATGTMNRLGAAAKEIGKVTEVIKQIAGKTNLLALNATIEAASAGEAGKGFSVVANEIKELARQSALAANDINSRIDGMQKNANDAIKVIGEISTIIGRISSAVREITLSVDRQMRTSSEISANVAEASTGAREIARALADVAMRANEMSGSVAHMARGAHNVAASIGDVSVAVMDSDSAVRRVSTSAEALAAMAVNLNYLVEKFVV